MTIFTASCSCLSKAACMCHDLQRTLRNVRIQALITSSVTQRRNAVPWLSAMRILMTTATTWQMHLKMTACHVKPPPKALCQLISYIPMRHSHLYTVPLLPTITVWLLCQTDPPILQPVMVSTLYSPHTRHYPTCHGWSQWETSTTAVRHQAHLPSPSSGHLPLEDTPSTQFLLLSLLATSPLTWTCLSGAATAATGDATFVRESLPLRAASGHMLASTLAKSLTSANSASDRSPRPPHCVATSDCTLEKSHTSVTAVARHSPNQPPFAFTWKHTSLDDNFHRD